MVTPSFLTTGREASYMGRGRPRKTRPKGIRPRLTPLETQLNLLRELEAFIRKEDYQRVAFFAGIIKRAAENEQKRQASGGEKVTCITGGVASTLCCDSGGRRNRAFRLPGMWKASGYEEVLVKKAPHTARRNGLAFNPAWA